MNSGIAKVKSQGGRTVWWVVTVRYRGVETGEYLSTQEVDSFSEVSIFPGVVKKTVLEDILKVQSHLSTDPDSVTNSTSAGKLVMQILNSFDSMDDVFEDVQEWFVLGRNLAMKISALLESDAISRTKPE